jgi:hypothetical protein
LGIESRSRAASSRPRQPVSAVADLPGLDAGRGGMEPKTALRRVRGEREERRQVIAARFECSGWNKDGEDRGGFGTATAKGGPGADARHVLDERYEPTLRMSPHPAGVRGRSPQIVRTPERLQPASGLYRYTPSGWRVTLRVTKNSSIFGATCRSSMSALPC